jgi:transcriptional regulator with XRE-family HTH domain
MQRFGEKLRTLRKQHGMTLQELAAALGYVAHGHLSEIETGKRKPKVEFVLKVANLFGVTADQLVRDEVDIPPKGPADIESESDANDRS